MGYSLDANGYVVPTQAFVAAVHHVAPPLTNIPTVSLVDGTPGVPVMVNTQAQTAGATFNRPGTRISDGENTVNTSTVLAMTARTNQNGQQPLYDYYNNRVV